VIAKAQNLTAVAGQGSVSKDINSPLPFTIHQHLTIFFQHTLQHWILASNEPKPGHLGFYGIQRFQTW
jgi:hypothetical protein